MPFGKRCCINNLLADCFLLPPAVTKIFIRCVMVKRLALKGLPLYRAAYTGRDAPVAAGGK